MSPTHQKHQGISDVGVSSDPNDPNRVVPLATISGCQKFDDQTKETLIAIAQRRYGMIVQAEVTLAVQFWHFGDVLMAIRNQHRYGRWLDFVKAQRWSYYRVSSALRIRQHHETPESLDRITVEEALGYDSRECKDFDDASTGGTEGEESIQPKLSGDVSTSQWLVDRCKRLAIEACGEPPTLDVAAADWNHKCARYFTEAIDGLKQAWDTKAVWCNPPYSATIIEAFVRKALDAAQRGTTSIFLVPWWNYPYLDLCERHGRIHRICSPVTFTRQDGTTLTMTISTAPRRWSSCLWAEDQAGIWNTDSEQRHEECHRRRG